MAKIVFFGTPDYVVCIPQDLKNTGHEILGVVTQPAKPVGREKIITVSPTEIWAKDNNVAVFDKDPGELVNELKSLNADLGIVASYGRILPLEIFSTFPFGLLNVHPSLLPKWRGASPIPAAILNGEITTGVTIIKMDEQMDHGPIISQKEFPLDQNSTTQNTLPLAFKMGAEMLVKIIPDYMNGKAKLIEQDHTKATFTWKTQDTKQTAYFDLQNPPSLEIIDRMARAFHPWPNAWTFWNNKIVKFYPERKIQLEGKTIVDYQTFKRGYPDFPLELS